MKKRTFVTKIIIATLVFAPLLRSIPLKPNDTSARALSTIEIITQSYSTNPDSPLSFDDNLLMDNALMDTSPDSVTDSSEDNYIRWVDFNIPYALLKHAYKLDNESYGSVPKLNFCRMLAYLAANNGNKFSTKRDTSKLNSLAAKLRDGASWADLTKDLKYYNYYLDCYNSIFAEFIGEYINPQGKLEYGLKAYHPIAKGYGYSDYDDFGNSRSYGFKRIHLGHDIFARTGTPVIATEGGIITECGWNQYGGWRIGIRSHDGKRYYYYAHLRKNHPYALGITKGATIAAGEVIGYVGATGYSRNENTNMSVNPHLHYGIQLIFHPSQVKGSKEIWIDVYSIVKFLNLNRAEVRRADNGKDFESFNIKRSLTDRKLLP